MDETIRDIQKKQVQMEQEIFALKNALTGIIQINQKIVKQCDEYRRQIDEISEYVAVKAIEQNNLKYELLDDKYKKEYIFYPIFRSNEETIRLIVEEKKSLARFGDGEFSIAFRISRQAFQRFDERLSARIWQVVNSNLNDLLIGIADNYGCLEKYNEQSALDIRHYMSDETRAMHAQILPREKIYSDAYITRAYVIYNDNMTDAPKKRFDMLKTIWYKKRIIIIEGAQTRLGVGNDLFDGAESIQRIIAPATNSFDRYDDIFASALDYADTADLFLLAIGPSSGVLAYDLCEKGYQAVDVGHIDLEYEWFLAGKGCRVPVPYKYNNEMPGGDYVEDIQDKEYLGQIIADFSN